MMNICMVLLIILFLAEPYEKSLQWGDVALSLTEKNKKLKEAELGFEKAR